MSPSPGRPLPIVVAGPYGFGTHDDPRLIVANVASIESSALPIFRAGQRAAVPRAGGGTSAGTGEMVRVGRQLGLQIFTSFAELPAL